MEGEKSNIRRPIIRGALMENNKARGLAYKRRKANVIKKTGELATLCGITVCTVCLGPDPDGGEVETFPKDPTLVKAIIERDRECEVSGRRKKTQAVREENNKELKKKRDLSGWSDNWLSNLSTQTLKILLRRLELKLRDVEARIELAQIDEKAAGKAHIVNYQPPQILGATATAGGGYSFSVPCVFGEEGLGEEQHIRNSMNVNYYGDCPRDQQQFFPIDHHQQQFFPFINSMNMSMSMNYYFDGCDCPSEEQQIWGLPIDRDNQQQILFPMSMTGAADDRQRMNSYHHHHHHHHHQLSVSPLEEHEHEHEHDELVYVQPLQSVRPPPPPPFGFGSYGYYQGDSSHTTAAAIPSPEAVDFRTFSLSDVPPFCYPYY